MDIHQAERATHMEELRWHGGTTAVLAHCCGNRSAAQGGGSRHRSPWKVLDGGIHHVRFSRRKGAEASHGQRHPGWQRIGHGRAAVAVQVRGAACGPREWAANMATASSMRRM